MKTFLKYGIYIRFVNCHSCALVITPFGIFSVSLTFFSSRFLVCAWTERDKRHDFLWHDYDVSILLVDAPLYYPLRFPPPWPTNELSTPYNGRIDRIPPRFATGNIRFTSFFFFIFKLISIFVLAFIAVKQ